MADWLLQSDREKEQGLPVAPFMDREKVTKPTAQIGFIKFVLTPMFESVAKVSVISSSTLFIYMKYYAKSLKFVVFRQMSKRINTCCRF